MINIMSDINAPFTFFGMLLLVFQNILGILWSEEFKQLFTNFKADLQVALNVNDSDRDLKIHEACDRFLANENVLPEPRRRTIAREMRSYPTIVSKYYMAYTLRLAIDQVDLDNGNARIIQSIVSDFAPLIFILRESFKP
jgi:hypothetical protein